MRSPGRWLLAASLLGLAVITAVALGAAYPMAQLHRLCRLTGYVALVALGATLAVSPLRRWTRGGPAWSRWRRALGLAAFGWGSLHGLAVITRLYPPPAWPALAWDPLPRAGLLVWIILAALALTSFRPPRRLLGVRRWRPLHRLVYVAAAVSGLHLLHGPWVPAWVLIAMAAVAAALLLGRLRPRRAET